MAVRAATSSAPPRPDAAASPAAPATSAVTHRRVCIRGVLRHGRRSGGQLSRLQDPAGVL